MPNGNRLIPKRLRWAFTVLVAAVSLSLPLAGIAAGQVGEEQAPEGSEEQGGEAAPPSTGDAPAPQEREENEVPPADGRPASADLSISARDEDDEAELRRDFRYRFRVVNEGPGTATDVRVLMTPPPAFSTDGASPSCDRAQSEGAYECVVNELRPGQEAVLTLRGEFDEPGRSSHWATVTSETPDPAFANNSAERRVEIGVEDDDRVVSRFESGAEGWTASGDVAARPTWVSSGGNSGGFARVVDGVRGDTIYREAPKKFEGPQTTFYGGELSFDLRQSHRDIQFEEDDVILKGAGTTLVYDVDDSPGTGWTRYAVKLSESGWKVSRTGRPASERQMRAVLSNLDRLAIRAEYRTGTDTDDLDNVMLETGSDRPSDESGTQPDSSPSARR